MKKVDLVRSLVERENLQHKQAVAIIDAVFSDIEQAVVAGEAVKIAGFGQFKVRDRAARMGRNPATGETIKIGAKRVFKFLPAKALKDAVMTKKGARKATLAKAAAKKVAPAKKTAKKAVTKKAAPARKTVKKAVRKTR